MKCRPCPRPKHREGGVQLIEFALVLPLLLLIFFVVGEGAAVVRVHQVLNNAAREGARIASGPEVSYYIYKTGPLNASLRAQVEQQVRNYVLLNYSSVNVASLVITISPDEVMVQNPATGVGIPTTVVTVSYPYELQYLPSFGAIPDIINLSATAQFRNILP